MSIKSKFFIKCAENAFFKFNDLETFTKMINKAIEADNKDSKAHILKASIFLRTGELLEVLAVLTYAIRVNPEKFEEYNEIFNITNELIENEEK